MTQQGVVVLQVLAGAGLKLILQLLVLTLLNGGEVLSVEHPLKVQLVGQGGQLLGGEIGHKTASFQNGEILRYWQLVCPDHSRLCGTLGFPSLSKSQTR